MMLENQEERVCLDRVHFTIDQMAMYISGVLVSWCLVSTVRSLMNVRCAACSV